MFLKILGLTSFAVLLIACSGGDKDPILQGDRVNILAAPQDIQLDPTALQTALDLPQPVVNAGWSQTGLLPNHAPQHLALATEVSLLWRAKVGDVGSNALNPPVVMGGRVFVVNQQQDVLAFHLDTGRKLWELTLPSAERETVLFQGGLAAIGDRVFITLGTGQVFAVQASTGELVWEATVGAPVRAAPAVYQDMLLVLSHDNRLFMLDVQDGTLQWTHSGIAEAITLTHSGTPAVGNGLVFVPYSTGDIYALTLADGAYQWHAALSRLSLSQRGGMIRDVAASPVLLGDAVYAVTVDGELLALDAQSGRRYWRQPISTSQTPWAAGNGLFTLSDAGQLVAVNRTDGKARWLVDLNTFLPEDAKKQAVRYWSGPILAGGRLIVASSDGYAVSVDPTDGRVLRSTELLAGHGVSVPPIVAEQTLIFLTDAGELVALR